jgi:hypothetical protein
MKKLLMLVVAAMALAIPSSALAHNGLDFTHEGQFVENPTEVQLTGTTIGTQGATEIHCPELDVVLDLLVDGTGEVTKYDCAGGKLNSTIPIDDTPTNVHSWEVEVIGHNHIEISGISIHNTYTHPSIPACVGSGTLQGSITMELIDNPENSSVVEINTDTLNELTNGGTDIRYYGLLTAEKTSGQETNIGIATT